MGIFTRNTMDSEDLSRVSGYCALRMLVTYHGLGVWPDDDRYRYVHFWLKQAGHRASTLMIAKIVRVADDVARHFQEERSEEVARLIETEDDALSEQLMAACREELEAQGVTTSKAS